MAGLKYLRNRPDVDIYRMAIMGHSFGGSLALLVADHDPGLKAVVSFAGSGYSWNLSPGLRFRLIRAVENIKSPILIVHAKNDYSTTPGFALDSVMNRLGRPHQLKIYPAFGKSTNEGHNFIFLDVKSWQADVFEFLSESLQP